MRLSSIAHLYRVRLQARVVLMQELLAVLGLSVGVALLFASQVASASLNGSVQQLANQLVGNMQFQLESRDPRGFDESLLGQVRQLPGVSAALPLLERPADAIGPTGRQAIELIGADPRLTLRESPLLKHFHYAQLARLHALANGRRPNRRPVPEHRSASARCHRKTASMTLASGQGGLRFRLPTCRIGTSARWSRQKCTARRRTGAFLPVRTFVHQSM